MVGGWAAPTSDARPSPASRVASQFQPAPATVPRGAGPVPSPDRFRGPLRRGSRRAPGQTRAELRIKHPNPTNDESINQPASQSDSVSQQSADRPMDRSAERLDSGLRPGLSGAAPIASRARAGRLPPSAPGSAPSPPLPPSARARRARRGSRGDPKGVGVRVGSSQANIPNQNASVQDVRPVRWSACLLGLRVYEPSMDGTSARRRRPRKRRRRAAHFGFCIVGFMCWRIER